jgi:cation:H+ antiporter
MITYILFVLGFVILIYGAYKLVEGAASLGEHLGLSQVVVGLTIVAIGTSLPELFINIFASIKGSSDLAIGNVLGSNIVNTYLIIGVAAVIYPFTVSRRTADILIPGTIFATAILFVLANDTIFGREEMLVGRPDGIILLIFFLIFIYFTLFNPEKDDNTQPDLKIRKMSIGKSLLFIVIGAVGLYFGGDWIVSGSEKISADYNISQSFIGLTLIALATSLPELVTTIISARKKNSALAIGNAVGSNIINIFLVLGVSALIRPIEYKESLNFEVYMVIAAAALLLLFVKVTGKKYNTVTRWEGILLIAAYAGYILFSAMRQ